MNLPFLLPRLAGGLLSLVCTIHLTATTRAQGAQDLIGRWNLTVQAVGGDHPSWLEVRKSGNQSLVGSFVGQFGSSRPISKVEVQGQQFRFAIPPQWEKRADDLIFLGQIHRDHLSGTTTDIEGRTVHWTAVPTPKLERSQAPDWGSAQPLFNGKSLEGWRPRDPALPNGWEVVNGILTNVRPGNDLITREEFTDFKLTAEFRYPAGSNSGIYLRGRYEMQIEDNFGDDPTNLKFGGIYGFLTPSVNAGKAAGQWQRAEIVLIGRQVTVVVNGERIIDRQTIPGCTGGALDNNEAAPGPIMIQGDHGPVEFRKISIVAAN